MHTDRFVPTVLLMFFVNFSSPCDAMQKTPMGTIAPVPVSTEKRLPAPTVKKPRGFKRRVPVDVQRTSRNDFDINIDEHRLQISASDYACTEAVMHRLKSIMKIHPDRALVDLNLITDVKLVLNDVKTVNESLLSFVETVLPGLRKIQCIVKPSKTLAKKERCSLKYRMARQTKLLQRKLNRTKPVSQKKLGKLVDCTITLHGSELAIRTESGETVNHVFALFDGPTPANGTSDLLLISHVTDLSLRVDAVEQTYFISRLNLAIMPLLKHIDFDLKPSKKFSMQDRDALAAHVADYGTMMKKLHGIDISVKIRHKNPFSCNFRAGFIAGAVAYAAFTIVAWPTGLPFLPMLVFAGLF